MTYFADVLVRRRIHDQPPNPVTCLVLFLLMLGAGLYGEILRYAS